MKQPSMPDTIHEKKKELRSAFRKLRTSVSETDKQLLDIALCDNIINSQEFKKAKTVLCYFPYGSEPNILPIAEKALSDGKQVAFPITDKGNSKMSFHTLSSLDNTVTGAYGIKEPHKSAPLTKSDTDTLCIVPALAYDSNGNRLGYGGGYYDRFLSEFVGFSILAIYSFLYTDTLPTDSFDIKVDKIITEKGAFDI
ncbi:MAG: 5-formyltetrahydrofolate cyclo-ligase [Ruminococcaceae bacterium]|nr:5-formyltetrahydrofolate cyclo-ligase [Oscillospiraceae bacterium]